MKTKTTRFGKGYAKGKAKWTHGTIMKIRGKVCEVQWEGEEEGGEVKEVDVDGSHARVVMKPFLLEKGALPGEVDEVACSIAAVIAGAIVERVDHLLFVIGPCAKTVVMSQPLLVWRIEMASGMVVGVNIQGGELV